MCVRVYARMPACVQEKERESNRKKSARSSFPPCLVSNARTDVDDRSRGMFAVPRDLRTGPDHRARSHESVDEGRFLDVRNFRATDVFLYSTVSIRTA